MSPALAGGFFTTRAAWEAPAFKGSGQEVTSRISTHRLGWKLAHDLPAPSREEAGTHSGACGFWCFCPQPSIRGITLFNTPIPAFVKTLLKWILGSPPALSYSSSLKSWDQTTFLQTTQEEMKVRVGEQTHDSVKRERLAGLSRDLSALPRRPRRPGGCARSSETVRAPGRRAGKEPACRCRRDGVLGSVPGSGRTLEEEMAAHSSILTWEMPWTEEPGGLQSKGSQRIGQD